MNEQIEKLEHGLMICEVTGTKLVHIEKADAEKILGLLKEQEFVIDALKSDLDETLKVLGEQQEIVRCLDCKHFNNHPMTHGVNFGECDLCAGFVPADWFCASGERKD